MKRLQLGNESFKVILQHFNDWLDILGYSESARVNAVSHIKEFLNWLEQRNINTIALLSLELVNSYYDYLKKRANQTKSGGGLSNASLNKHQHALRTFRRYLKVHNALNVPMHLQQESTNSKTIEIFTQDEVKALFKAVNNSGLPNHYKQRDLAMLTLLYSCGLRKSEAIKLNMKEVLFSEKRLVIRNPKNKRDRYVPINTYNLGLLQDYMYDGRLEFGNYNKTEAVLISYRGNRLVGKAIPYRLQEILNQTEDKTLIAKGIHAHKLRHSIATHLLQNKVPIEHISRFLGHSSLESTQIYTQVLKTVKQ